MIINQIGENSGLVSHSADERRENKTSFYELNIIIPVYNEEDTFLQSKNGS
jgi:hypothetical protein